MVYFDTTNRSPLSPKNIKQPTLYLPTSRETCYENRPLDVKFRLMACAIPLMSFFGNLVGVTTQASHSFMQTAFFGVSSTEIFNLGRKGQPNFECFRCAVSLIGFAVASYRAALSLRSSTTWKRFVSVQHVDVCLCCPLILRPMTLPRRRS